jgi:hypothetical protein
MPGAFRVPVSAPVGAKLCEDLKVLIEHLSE